MTVNHVPGERPGQGDAPAGTRPAAAALPVEHRVIGPPGCGKTTYLSRQVAGAVAAGLRPLVISLTRAAAAEAAGRDLPIPAERVGTLHSQCYHALRRPELADTPENLRLWNAAHPEYALSGGVDLDGDNAAAAGYGSEPHRSRRPDELMSWYQALRSRMEPVPPEGPLARFVRRWQEWLIERDMCDFTGLIERALAEGTPPPGRPDVIFVDEAQDLSRLELALTRQWGRQAGRLALVGDPDQNLYGWRGAEGGAFAGPDHAGFRVDQRTLSQSWRVPAAVHRTATAWIERSPLRTPVEYRPRAAAGRVREGQGTWERPPAVIDDIEGELAAGRTAMLLATCSYMLDLAVAELRKRGLPFHNPWRRRQGKWNPLGGSARGIASARRLAAFLNHVEGAGWTLGDLEKWTPTVTAQAALTEGRKGLAQLQERWPDPEEPLPEAELERTLTRWAVDAGLGPDLEWYRANLLKSWQERLEYPLRIAERRGRTALLEEPQVVIGTIHSVKGAEADVVYLFPDLSAAGMQEWLGSAERQAAVYRLFYVGMTRAREELVLCPAASALAVDWPPLLEAVSGN